MIIDIKSKNDKLLLSTLTHRLRLKSRLLTREEKEDIGLLNAMYEGKKTGYVSEREVVRILNYTPQI